MWSIDLRAQAEAHPWRTVVIAFAVGAGLALAERSRSTLVRAATGALAGSIIDTLRHSVPTSKVTATASTASGSHSLS